MCIVSTVDRWKVRVVVEVCLVVLKQKRTVHTTLHTSTVSKYGTGNGDCASWTVHTVRTIP